MSDAPPLSAPLLLDESLLDITSVDHALSTARSVRRKLDFERPLEPSVLHDCINVATQAPTGLDGENWRFVIVSDADLKAEIAGIYTRVLTDIFAARDMPMKPTHKALIERLHEIPAMIFVCAIGKPIENDLSNQIAFFGSILPAAWSLMLTLRARGIGTTWTSLLSSQQAEVASILNIPDNVTQTVMLPVAYTKGAKLKPAARMAADQVTYWNGWEQGQPK